jgi:flagellar basal-body rod protein FlgC
MSTVPTIKMLPLLTNSTEQGPRPPFARPLDVAKSGMSVQRLRMEVAASNIANVETTRTEAGGPYRRRVVRLEEAMRDGGIPQFPPLPLDPANPAAIPSGTDGREGVQAVAIEEDASEGPLVYNPGHPDADTAGYVRMPNVRVTDELVDIMEAKRIYEANATVFQAAKQMLRRALDI